MWWGKKLVFQGCGLRRPMSKWIDGLYYLDLMNGYGLEDMHGQLWYVAYTQLIMIYPVDKAYPFINSVK